MSDKQALSVQALLRSFRVTGADQAAIRQVMACTDELTGYALQADWSSVLDVMERRRRLLQQLIDGSDGQLNPEVAALSAAVEESERALMRVIAHAVAGSRWNGAVFKMYH